jgi:hypothetical protein
MTSINSHKTQINHYYRCFGCAKNHPSENSAVGCCAVVQEIFECAECGEKFAYERPAKEHVKQSHEAVAKDGAVCQKP